MAEGQRLNVFAVWSYRLGLAKHFSEVSMSAETKAIQTQIISQINVFLAEKNLSLRGVWSGPGPCTSERFYAAQQI